MTIQTGRRCDPLQSLLQSLSRYSKVLGLSEDTTTTFPETVCSTLVCFSMFRNESPVVVPGKSFVLTICKSLSSMTLSETIMQDFVSQEGKEITDRVL